MLGSIGGDLIGSYYERRGTKDKDFTPLVRDESRFTDDSVMTIAIARAIVGDESYEQAMVSLGRRYPYAGYGGSFSLWLQDDARRPYGSWGNGAAMRVSPVGFAFDRVEEVLAEAERSAAVSHDHPEGIKGAQAVALGVFLARNGADKEEIRSELSGRFGYDLQRAADVIRPHYSFDVSSQGSVPEAIIAFLDANSYEDAVRIAVSLGGDADTQACIAGALAEAYYRDLPPVVYEEIRKRLPTDLMEVVTAYCASYMPWNVEHLP